MRRNRIIIIGNCGAGKTYLARAMGKSYGVPVTNLDSIYFVPRTLSQTRPVGEIDHAIWNIQQEKKWIVEGVHGGLVKRLLGDCDFLIWLDMDWPACQKNLQARGPEAIGIIDQNEAQRWFNWLNHWAESYWEGDDANSYRAHKTIFESFPGNRERLCSRRSMDHFIASCGSK